MLLILLGLLILITLAFCQLASRREWAANWVLRKILHIVAVGSCAVAAYTAEAYDHATELIWTVSIATVLLMPLVHLTNFMREEQERPAHGIYLFPLAFLLISWASTEVASAAFPMLVLAVCDAAATFAGKLIDRRKERSDLLVDIKYLQEAPHSPMTTPYFLTSDPKTLVGNLAFLLSFLVVFQFDFSLHYYLNDLNTPYPWGIASNLEIFSFAFLMGLVLTAVEALGSSGYDNLLVPLATFGIFGLLHNSGGYDSLIETRNAFNYTTLVAIPFCLWTVHRESLQPGAAILAAIMGIFIVISVGHLWVIPLLFFFASSSLIDKILPSKAVAGDAKQQQARDWFQVVANGGVFLIAAIQIHALNPLLEYTLLALAATVTADTWSSQVGQYFSRPTWDLVRWKKVPVGLSGGVSGPGTLAGLLGAVCVAALSFFLVAEPSLILFLAITATGFAGMLVDSIIGSLAQQKFRDSETGLLSDTPSKTNVPYSGIPSFNNDLTNLATTIVILFGCILIHSSLLP